MSIDSNKIMNVAAAKVLYDDLRTRLEDKVENRMIGKAYGIAQLDANKKIPSNQLPSYVDDVIEFATFNNFPLTGESGKIYIASNTNRTYRWSGSTYVEISSSLALGETESSAYRGDRGAIAYEHAENKGSAYIKGLYKVATNAEGHVVNAQSVTKQDITNLGIPGEVPTKISQLQNDSGFITSFTQTDPTVPAWAKTINKPVYTASEVGALPDDTIIPTKLSDLTNDVGYITSHQDISGKADKTEIPTKVSDLTNDIGYISSYTETDPTVPSWAKSATKPVYTAQEVGALPSDTVIPTKVSDLTNDAGYLTSYIETDPTVPAWAKAANKPSYTAVEVGALSDNTVIPTKVSDLTDDSGHYTKPSGGIPASDLASGVIPDLTNYVQNTDYATDSTAGVVKIDVSNSAIGISNGILYLSTTTEATIKNGTSNIRPIFPHQQHISTFYGLAKAAGDTTQAVSNNAVGTYTDTAKSAIRSMIGAGVGSITNAIIGQGTSVEKSIVTNGVIKISTAFDINSGNELIIRSPSLNTIKAGTNTAWPLTPSVQHQSVFYGLAKAAGDTTQGQSDNAVGSYTDNAKDKIQQMLGIDQLIAKHEEYAIAESAISTNDLFIMSGKLYKATADIAANGTITPGTNCDKVSIDDVFVKKTDYADASTGGVVKIPPASGLVIVNGELKVRAAYTTDIKSGSSSFFPIVPNYQHNATFYGLAKAAGDTTQASSNNAVGTYTASAKTAIQTMLGVETGVTNVETVTGLTPTITANANTRYVCGELTSLSFTPCVSGVCDVIFTSGSTVTVLTVPNTIKWPGWFDPTSLDVNTIYEINILDGTYGVVAVWAT